MVKLTISGWRIDCERVSLQAFSKRKQERNRRVFQVDDSVEGMFKCMVQRVCCARETDFLDLERLCVAGTLIGSQQRSWYLTSPAG
jgi:hypothetical protein